MNERPTFEILTFATEAATKLLRLQILVLTLEQLNRAVKIRSEMKNQEEIGEIVGDDVLQRRKDMHGMEAGVAQLTGDPTVFPAFEDLTPYDPSLPRSLKPKVEPGPNNPPHRAIVFNRAVPVDERRRLMREHLNSLGHPDFPDGRIERQEVA